MIRGKHLKKSGLLIFAVLALSSSVGLAADKKIAIANLGPHPVLKMVVDGFKAGLASQGYKEGTDVEFVYKDANFDPSLVAQVLTALEASSPDLLFTVTTPITQASKRVIRNKSLPIVFAPVTDPVDAGLVPSWNKGSARIVGASNLQDMDTVIAQSKAILGQVKSMGLLFNPGDANDVVNVRYAKAAAKKAGVELKAISVETTNDIPTRVQGLKGVDFIYLIPSSMLQPALPVVAAAAKRNKIPVINSSPAGVKAGHVLAAVSVSWRDVGARAGKLAAKIFKGAKPSDLAIYKPKPNDHKVFLSAKRFKAMNMSVPATFKNCKCIM
jgi:putative tryptophan/tyrosine transport system substrate-binding protein